MRHDRTMEQITFPVPTECQYLTEETKLKVFNNVEQNDQGSKVEGFFQLSDEMYSEMCWQKMLIGKLPGKTFMFCSAQFI